MNVNLTELMTEYKPYVDQFNAQPRWFDRMAILPSGKPLYLYQIWRATPDKKARVITEYTDPNDLNVVYGLMTLVDLYISEQMELVKRVTDICEKQGINDVQFINPFVDPEYVAFDDGDLARVQILSTQLTDDLFPDYKYCIAFIKCGKDLYDGIKYPFAVKLIIYAQQEYSDEGYRMSDEVYKTFKQPAVVYHDDPDFDKKIGDMVVETCRFINEDIQKFNAHIHEEFTTRRKWINDFINDDDTTIGDLDEIIDFITNHLC